VIFMEKETVFEKYARWIEFSKMHYNAVTWISLTLIITVIVGVSSWLLSLAIIRELTLIPFAFSSAVLILLLGYPYLRKESIINSIEKNFSDALKQMADTLKAGDTYESALREVANSDYGRLSEEIDLALRRLEEGENLETALGVFADRVDSRLIRRTVIIILDSIKSGASLSDILEEIAEDVRDMYRIKEERKSTTTMQFMFMVASGGIIAPLIFGEVNSVMTVFSLVTTQALSEAQMVAATQTTTFMFMLVEAYLIIEIIGTGLMMSIIREGKVNKSIIYIPVLLLLAFIVYYLAKFVIGSALVGSL